jgi:hypothetical protein
LQREIAAIRTAVLERLHRSGRTGYLWIPGQHELRAATARDLGLPRTETTIGETDRMEAALASLPIAPNRSPLPIVIRERSDFGDWVLRPSRLRR